MKRITILMIAGILFPYILHAQYPSNPPPYKKSVDPDAVLSSFFKDNSSKEGFTYVYAQKDAVKDVVKDAIPAKIINEFDKIAFVKVLTYKGFYTQTQEEEIKKFRYIIRKSQYELILKMIDGVGINEVYQKKGKENRFDKVFINRDEGSLTYIWVSGTIAKE